MFLFYRIDKIISVKGKLNLASFSGSSAKNTNFQLHTVSGYWTVSCMFDLVKF